MPCLVVLSILLVSYAMTFTRALVFTDAYISRYEFPNGARRRVRAEDFINAGSEQMRLLQVNTTPLLIALLT